MLKTKWLIWIIFFIVFIYKANVPRLPMYTCVIVIKPESHVKWNFILFLHEFLLCWVCTFFISSIKTEAVNGGDTKDSYWILLTFSQPCVRITFAKASKNQEELHFWLISRFPLYCKFRIHQLFMLLHVDTSKVLGTTAIQKCEL